MCELFGFTSKEEEVINDYLKNFFNHCHCHPHGWGIAKLDDNKTIIKKGAEKAVESEYLAEKLESPIKTKNFLAHIRYATRGCTNDKNCHPFTKKDNHGRTWTLIHNGTLFCCERLNQYIPQQNGDTDSERILLHVINEINEKEKGKILTDEEQFQIIENVILKITKDNKVNIILHNGETMYVHTNLKNTLQYQTNDKHIIFSTHPLSKDKWQQVPINQLFSFKNGELIQKGKKHNNEYKISQEDLEILAHMIDDFKNNLCVTKQI